MVFDGEASTGMPSPEKCFTPPFQRSKESRRAAAASSTLQTYTAPALTTDYFKGMSVMHVFLTANYFSSVHLSVAGGLDSRCHLFCLAASCSVSLVGGVHVLNKVHRESKEKKATSFTDVSCRLTFVQCAPAGVYMQFL